LTETRPTVRPAGWPSRLWWTAFTLREIAATRGIPWLAADRLEALQARRVRAMVEHAATTVPFYRDAMRARGLSIDDFASAADLAKLPLVTGADVAADPQRFLSSAVAGEPLLEMATSGTTGHAKRIWWDRAAVFRARAAGLHQRRVMADVLGTTRGVRMLLVVRPGGTSDDVRAFHEAHAWLPDPLAECRALSPADDFASNVDLVNHLRPDVLFGFASYVGALYRWALAHRRTIHAPRLVLYGGEQMPAADAELLATTYGSVVRSTYQACEALRIAFACAHGGLHLYADQVAVRIADAAGRSLGPGERGRIVLSNLTNRATVLLNYVIGDTGALAGSACACGRTLPMLASLDGRADDLVRLPGGEVAHDSVLLSRLYAVPGVTRLQLVQEELARFTIRVSHAGALADADLRERLVRALGDALGGHRVFVAVEIHDTLESDASGKFRTVVSRLGAPAPTGIAV
jgi:phenylacetate-CoA ligase